MNLLEAVQPARQGEVCEQDLAVLPVEVVLGLCVGQPESGDFQELLATLLAEVVADLQERRDLTGEDDLRVEEGVGGVAHANDLSMGTALRRVPVVGWGEPVDPAPDGTDPLAVGVTHNERAVPLLHGVLGDHQAELRGRLAEGPQDLACL